MQLFMVPLCAYGPRRDKTCLRCFLQSETLLSYSDQPESLDIALSNKQITKELIRLGGCAGWCAPVVSKHPKTGFLASTPICQHIIQVKSLEWHQIFIETCKYSCIPPFCILKCSLQVCRCLYE